MGPTPAREARGERQPASAGQGRPPWGRWDGGSRGESAKRVGELPAPRGCTWKQSEHDNVPP